MNFTSNLINVFSLKYLKRKQIGQTFCCANWVQNEVSLSMFCIAMGAFIRRNIVYKLVGSSLQVIPIRISLKFLCLVRGLQIYTKGHFLLPAL